MGLKSVNGFYRLLVLWYSNMQLDFANRILSGSGGWDMNAITLSDAMPGNRYCILEIKEENRLVNRLSSMGLLCGSTIEVCQNHKKQPILLFARDTLVAIGREESKKNYGRRC